MSNDNNHLGIDFLVHRGIILTLIRPTLSYWSEAWTVTSDEMNAVRIFERKIVRRIYGPINEG
jgi:hypothetical protein